MLATWQERLQKHFEDLRRARSATVGDKPIFALEHGLDTAALNDLAVDIKNHAAKATPLSSHILPWVVYAAEIGYRFSGDEYWQTFEEETTGWNIHGNRDWLRECFRVFHKKFGGAQPSGPWAKHFSIICWPITHAILPRDLQRQLAEVLYNMRDLFSTELLESPMSLGERIAAQSWNATSRFQNFAQEPQLVGQIATALLLRGGERSESLVLPATLNRIVTDLGRTHAARERLRDAQRVAQQRVQFHGLSSRNATAIEKDHPKSLHEAREQVVALSIEPRLLLRPIDTDSWNVMLELPDLSHLLVKFPALRNVLTNSRCVVAGSSGRPLARGALLHGPLSVILHSWPGSEELLLQFENPVPSWFEYLLRADCLLRPGPRWLFRIASDGQAYGLHGNLVRPNQSYVIATSRALEVAPGVRLNRLACEGIHGARLDIPPGIPGEWAGYLKDLGLNQAKSVHVWPAGLAAASWDGEGRAEWLTSDSPCIAIRPDHIVDSIITTLQNAEGQRLEVPSPSTDSPCFIELPRLPVGVYVLRVSVRPLGSSVKEEAAELEIGVREARTWSPGTGAAGPLRISVDPPAPTLEQIWEGRATIDIRGPTGRQIVPTISLFERRSTLPTLRKRLPALSIPADATDWRAHFEKYFRAAKDAQNHYDPAQSCLVELKADELGTLSFTCEREFSPLRWIVRRTGRDYGLSLQDDSGSAIRATVIMFDFAKPDMPVPIDAAKLSSGYSVPASGGLYWAYNDSYDCAVIVAPVAQKLTLQELNIKPEVAHAPRSVATAENLLSLIKLWSRARDTGLFSAARRQTVVAALLQKLFVTIGGEKGERMPSPKKSVGNRLAVQLLRDCPILARLGTKDRVIKFASIARNTLQLRVPPPVVVGRSVRGKLLRKIYGPEHPDWLCELALRLASSPETVHAWAGTNLRGGLQRLIGTPDLARAARVLVLAVDQQASASTLNQQHRGWEW